MISRRKLSKAAWWITPPIIWEQYLRLRKLGHVFPWQTFRTMATAIDPKPLLVGRFADIHNKFCGLDPFTGEAYRYMHYNLCYFANLCRNVPGDFVCAGVSFGASVKIVYEFVDFSNLGKTFHLIDPLEGKTDTGQISPNYNRDPDYILKQYPEGAPIVLHREFIPLRLSGPLAFVFTDTGNPEAESESLPIFYGDLSQGGIIVIGGQYGHNIKSFEPYFQNLGVTPLWLPSGQGVIIKQ